MRGVKCFNLSDAISTWKNKTRVDLEAAKCDVVCANCHRMREFKRATNCEYPDPSETWHIGMDEVTICSAQVAQ